MKHVDMLTEASEELRKIPKVVPKINGMKRGIPYEWDYQDHTQFDVATLARVGDLIGEVATVELWKENGRVCYDLHEELADALYRSRMVAVPGSLFDRLPHINPMIVFPEAWPVDNGESGTAYVRCFFVVGWNGNALCNTDDPDLEGHALLFCYDVTDEETGEQVPGGARDLIPLPTAMEKFSITEAISFAQRWHGEASKKDFKDLMETFKPLLERAFSVLTYLCTDNRDVIEPEVEVRRRKKTGKNRKSPDRDPFWVRVGYYVGPALHEARKRAASPKDAGVSIPSGVEYGPQHRAGHFKTVYFGPGKKQYTSKWIKPYWTKKEELPADFDPPTQVVPVNPQRADPLRRRKTIGK
ncbi:hypothetical protein PV336_16495 [Streptomyces sp. MI02-2A]|uniref:hypothetical protein n=1 Tax=Streptomyces sp. MI02-2A TaxID=3028688 RepID=UPI0029B9757B|nr:hypothetical protein [Streptomyces sp. MI02-2A]MDX3260818.1 hypothetical protein [Streptomyces sp. MI02-2A]